MLADYTYYTGTYQGNQIGAGDFPRLVARAQTYLEGVDGVITAPVADKYKMAACAVAEAWQINEQGGDLASQSVGSWSRSYAQKIPKSDKQRLLEAARLYLGASWGVYWA